MVDTAGQAYLMTPTDGAGPGVLVLHSWWGLNPGIKSVVESLADAGFTALAPDLFNGDVPIDVRQAARVLGDADVDSSAALILSSIAALRAHSSDPGAPVAVIGYSMGASWALWVATRQPDSVTAVVGHYGLQDIDFTDLKARVLMHFAESDPLVSEDEAVEMHSHLLLLEKDVQFQSYPGTRHHFAESTVAMLDGAGDTGDRNEVELAAAEQAWQRTLDFLRAH